MGPNLPADDDGDRGSQQPDEQSLSHSASTHHGKTHTHTQTLRDGVEDFFFSPTLMARGTESLPCQHKLGKMMTQPPSTNPPHTVQCVGTETVRCVYESCVQNLQQKHLPSSRLTVLRAPVQTVGDGQTKFTTARGRIRIGRDRARQRRKNVSVKGGFVKSSRSEVRRHRRS